jgi:heptosyltransferase III
MRKREIKHIIISRTDAIVDVILTLPVAGFIKSVFPEIKVSFLCKSYTEEIVKRCTYVDEVVIWDEQYPEKLTEYIKVNQVDAFLHVFPNKTIAKLSSKAKIKHNIGTRNRWFHWLYLNKRVKLSRKNSDLHEAQLNAQLLSNYLGLDVPSMTRLQSWHTFKNKETQEKVVILHPSSNGSAREWAWLHYRALIDLIVAQHPDYKIFISGTEKDKARLSIEEVELPSQVELGFGKFSLNQFIQFIAKAEVLVGASTGPLHIASALGIKAIGIYPSRRPMFPQRWGPLGKNALALTKDLKCSDCGALCACMEAVTPFEVFKKLNLGR